MGSDLNKREKITQRPQRFFGIGGGFANHLGIQSHSGQLNEAGVICFGKIYGHHLPSLDDHPSPLQIAMGNTKLGGKDIHRANRKNSQAHRRVANAVDDFVERAIATCCNDDLHSGLHSLGSETTGVTRFGGEPHGHSA